MMTPFEVIDNEGSGHSLEERTAAEVGGNWTVWDAEPAKEDQIRLMVTREHLDANPRYQD